jgi:hypothetical protein
MKEVRGLLHQFPLIAEKGVTDVSYPNPKMMMARRRRNHRISAKVLVTVCTRGPVARKPLRKYNDFHLQEAQGRGEGVEVRGEREEGGERAEGVRRTDDHAWRASM